MPVPRAVPSWRLRATTLFFFGEELEGPLSLFSTRSATVSVTNLFGSSPQKEDALLRSFVKENGKVGWARIGRVLGRSGKQCRNRWYNALDPELSDVSVLTSGLTLGSSSGSRFLV
jgi:hypothetical protein